MFNLIFNKLDEYEKLKNAPDKEAEILDLMSRAIKEKKGLHNLATRYSSSTQPIIVRALSFVLSREVFNDPANLWNIIFLMIKQLQCKKDESTLINCLTAIQGMCITYDKCSFSLEESELLYHFLLFCFDQTVFVQRGVVAVLSLMCQNDIFTDIFNPLQLSIFREKLMQISKLNDKLINDEFGSLTKFINK